MTTIAAAIATIVFLRSDDSTPSVAVKPTIDVFQETPPADLSQNTSETAEPEAESPKMTDPAVETPQTEPNVESPTNPSNVNPATPEKIDVPKVVELPKVDAVAPDRPATLKLEQPATTPRPDSPEIPPFGAKPELEPSAGTDTATVPPAAPSTPDPVQDEIRKPAVESIPFSAVPFKALKPTRLESTLAGVSYDRVTLRNFVQDFSAIIDAPIGIDWRELERAGWNSEIPIRAKYDRITASDALRKTLSTLVLELHVGETHATVARSPDREAHLRSRYAVEDLFDKDAPQAADMAATMKRMLAPGTWSADGIVWSDGAYSITNSSGTHDDCVVWFEKLRNARGLPLRTKYDPTQSQLRRFNPERFALTSRATRAAKLGATPVTAVFGQAETLRTIVGHLERRTGAILLWDYAALEQAGVSPESTVGLTIEDRPLSEALNALLEPAGLVAVPIDARSFSITTPTECEKRPTVEWYPLAKEIAAGRLPEGEPELRAWLAQRRVNRNAAQAQEEFYWDAPSRTLVVRAAAPAQAVIEALLYPLARPSVAGTMRD
ncbi:MAG: hypothetical protein QM811_19205 [Pirellulales bacterium]